MDIKDLQKPTMYLCDNCKRAVPGDQILPGQVIIEGDKTERLLLCNYCLLVEAERDLNTRHFQAGEDKKYMVKRPNKTLHYFRERKNSYKIKQASR